MSIFIKFTENNRAERESWYFYFMVDDSQMKDLEYVKNRLRTK